jgi:hypothetical protein
MMATAKREAIWQLSFACAGKEWRRRYLHPLNSM